MKVRVVRTPSMCCGVLAMGYEGNAEVIFMKGNVSYVTGEPFEDDVCIIDGQYLCWFSDVVELNKVH